MSGLPIKSRASQKRATKSRKSRKDCDLLFSVDLIAVRRDTLKCIGIGSVLRVQLQKQGDAVAAVCCDVLSNQIIGSLAAFEGLTQLINCIKAGVEYTALVEEVTHTQCMVCISRK